MKDKAINTAKIVKTQRDIDRPETPIQVLTKTQAMHYAYRGDYLFFTIYQKIGLFTCEGFAFIFYDQERETVSFIKRWTRNKFLLKRKGIPLFSRETYDDDNDKILDFFERSIDSLFDKNALIEVRPGFRYYDDGVAICNQENNQVA